MEAPSIAPLQLNPVSCSTREVEWMMEHVRECTHVSSCGRDGLSGAVVLVVDCCVVWPGERGERSEGGSKDDNHGELHGFVCSTLRLTGLSKGGRVARKLRGAPLLCTGWCTPVPRPLE